MSDPLEIQIRMRPIWLRPRIMSAAMPRSVIQSWGASMRAGPISSVPKRCSHIGSVVSDIVPAVLRRARGTVWRALAFAVLLLWQAMWSAVLHRFAAPTWLIASVGSLLVAWPIATALPVIG